MLALQYLLLKIHRMRKILAPENIPTVTETWVGVATFWVCQFVLNVVGIWILDILFVRPGTSGLFVDGPVQPSGIRGAVRLLLDRIVFSWMLHHGLVILLDFVPPFTRDLQGDPQRELTKLLSRAIELLTFIHKIAIGPDTADAPPFPIKTPIQDSNSRSSTQTVRLQRTHHHTEGPRILAWNLVVEKDALNEMKEILGPPGGFGELGFSVGGDGIRFEAMGVGTSFVLDFEVLPPEERRAVTVRRKTK